MTPRVKVSSGYFGDLLFTLTRTGGLSTDDFIANNDGVFFSADLSDGRNAGTQAGASASIPRPLNNPGA